MEPELDGRFDKAQRHLVEPIGTIRVDLGSFVWALRHVFRPTWYHRRNATPNRRSEEHTSELQSLMRISYAVFCLKKKKKLKKKYTTYIHKYTIDKTKQSHMNHTNNLM